MTGRWFSQGLAADIQAAGGVMTADDLRAAQPIFKPALHAQVWSSDSAYNLTLMRNESLFARASMIPGPALFSQTLPGTSIHWLHCRAIESLSSACKISWECWVVMQVRLASSFCPLCSPCLSVCSDSSAVYRSLA